MSKKSFKDIEQIIRNAAEANTPAFDESAWKKMEVLLDKENDRKRPFIFWLWWLIPLLISGALIGRYTLNNSEINSVKRTSEINTGGKKIMTNTVQGTGLFGDKTEEKDLPILVDRITGNDENMVGTLIDGVGQNKGITRINNSKPGSYGELSPKNKTSEQLPGQMTVFISAASPETDVEISTQTKKSDAVKLLEKDTEPARAEEIVVVKIEAEKGQEKEVENILDSLIGKQTNDKITKKKLSKFYVIVATGAEASGVKLLSVDKITARAGLAVGYQLSKNLSVQTGFYVSNKKYKAGPGDYKTKPGSYWNTVNITSVDANCKVYEIPLNLRYDFKVGKKLSAFAAAGLSSYIMKEEEYYFYYDRYGTQHKGETSYKGNKSLFSVLRISAGIEKKIGKRFSVFASPGLAIPLAGVGEGEVKLYSTDIMFGLKFTPARKR